MVCVCVRLIILYNDWNKLMESIYGIILDMN